MEPSKNTPPQASRFTPHASKARIRWLCRRGMKELDVLLERYFEAEFDALDVNDQALFYALLQHEDPDLHAWMLGRVAAPDPALQELVTRIREYSAAGTH